MIAGLFVIGDGFDGLLGGNDARAKLCSELQEHVKTRLSRHKYPRWVVFAADLPKNDRGKVDRKTLIAREREGQNPWR